jgi:AraC-like DNA-binding protein
MERRRKRSLPAERVEFWQPANLPGVRILTVRESMHRWTLFHEGYALTMVNAGTGAWRYRRKERQIHSDTMMLIEPGEVHVTTKVTSPAGFDTLFVDASAMAAVAERCGMPRGFPHFKATDSSDPTLLAAFTAAQATILDMSSEALECSEAFEVALYELFRRACEATPEKSASGVKRILRARDLIHDLQTSRDGDGPMSMADLASAVGLTPIQLIRGFKALLGVPPYQYLVRLRMARAQRLIARGPTAQIRSLTDVALEIGFCDLAHMDKHFRRVLRVSPSAYAAGISLPKKWGRAQGRR